MGEQMTYQKLCKELQVSRATLDRVINDRPGVSDERRQEILKRIEEIGFKPNSVGKALAMQKRTKFGVVISSDLTPEGNELFGRVYEGMRYATKQYGSKGVEFEFASLISGKVEEQIAMIQKMVREHVSGIAISMEAVSPQLVDVIRKAMAEQIKFVFYFNVRGLFTKDEKETLPQGQYYEVRIDSYKEGLLAANLMGNYLGGQGKVAILSGLEKNVFHQGRARAAKQKLDEKFPDITTVGVISNCYPKEKVRKEICRVLDENPDLNGIIASCGNNIEIMEEICKRGLQNKIKTIFFDCTEWAEKSVRSGDLDILIGVDLYKLGYSTINTLYNLVFSNEVNHIDTDLPTVIKMKESYESE